MCSTIISGESNRLITNQSIFYRICNPHLMFWCLHNHHLHYIKTKCNAQLVELVVTNTCGLSSFILSVQIVIFSKQTELGRQTPARYYKYSLILCLTLTEISFTVVTCNVFHLCLNVGRRVQNKHITHFLIWKILICITKR